MEPRLASLSVSLHVHPRRLPRRQQADGQPGDERHQQREASATGSSPISSDARNQVGAQNTTTARSAHCASSTPTRAAEQGHDHAFGHQLAHHVGATGAEREARRDFLAASGEAREQQVGDVRARNQEHAAHRAEQHQVALALLADGIVEQRHHLDLRRRIDVGRVRCAVAGGDDVHGLARLLQRDARAQPCDRPGRSSRRCSIATGTRNGTSAGRGTQIWNWFRGNADAASGRTPMIVYGAPSSVSACPRIDGSRLKRCCQMRMADEHDALAAGAVLVCREIAAQQRLEAQRRQQRGRGVKPDQLLGVSPSGQRERVARREREVAEHLLALLHFEEAGIRKADAREVSAPRSSSSI